MESKTPYKPIILTKIKFKSKLDNAVTKGLNLSLCQIPAASLYKFNKAFISYTKKYTTKHTTHEKSNNNCSPTQIFIKV